MDHVADDRAGPDDRHLHHDVVKLFRPHARQARHLRAAFDLKHADGVRLLHGGIRCGIIFRKMRQIDFFAVMIADQLQ